MIMGRDSSKNEKGILSGYWTSLYIAWTQCLNIRKYINFKKIGS